MKKYFLLPILTSILFLTSCSDQLERFPVDQLVDETAFQTVSDLQNGVNSVLGGLNIDDVVQFNAAFTDNTIQGKDSGGQALAIINQRLTPDQANVGFWVDRYNTLNRINRVLAAADRITPSANDRVAYNNIRGILLALRGQIHSDLLIYHSFDIKDRNSLGVVYQNFVQTDGKGERNTTGEVLDLIEQDFTEATPLITSTDINFPTRDFITFQRARNALWTGNYGDAVTFANAIIAKYPLADAQQYSDMFNNDADATEVIWKYDNVQGSNNNVAGNFRFTASVEDSNFISISQGFFAEIDPNDVRFGVLVAPDGAGSNFNNAPIPDYGIDKYPPNADTNFINDFKAMRVSEMYLVRAEAYAMQDQFTQAANDVRAIRTIRNSPVVTPGAYTGRVQALTDIKAERRIELAFEGHRYLDIKRMKDILNVGIVRSPLDCSSGCEIPVNDERFIFPIPTVEIIGNDEITQAPGY